MPGLSTGTPNTEDYAIGRGILYLAPYVEGTNPAEYAYRDVGNVSAFNINVEEETLEHRSSRSGLKVLDKEIVVSSDMVMSITLDEINFDNLGLFFKSTPTTYTNPAKTGFSETAMIAAGNLTADSVNRYYELVNPAATDPAEARLYDVETADIVLTTTNASPVTLVDGTDYTLDTNGEFARIFLLNSAAVQTAIGNSEGIDIECTAEATANDVLTLDMLNLACNEFAMTFVGENPTCAAGTTPTLIEYHWNRVNITPDGEFAAISDEWQELTLSAKALKTTSVNDINSTGYVRYVLSS